MTDSIAGVSVWMPFIYFASGAASLIDEVVWTRLLKLTLGNTVQASSIVVSMFMGGLALGAYIMSRHAGRIRRPLRSYALLELYATASAASVPLILQFADAGYRSLYRGWRPSPEALLVVQVFVSAFIVLVPAMIMGSTLPLVAHYIARRREQVGHLVGRLYALNTFGAACGCFLAGFVFIRVLGVWGALLVAAVINLGVAIGSWLLSRRSEALVAPPQQPLRTTSRARGCPSLRRPLAAPCVLLQWVDQYWLRTHLDAIDRDPNRRLHLCVFRCADGILARQLRWGNCR